MTVTSGLVTASGYTSMLEEPDHGIQLAALETLNKIIDEFWPEVADAISQIESLHEDKTFPNRELAAVVASKVFFHLEEYADAVRLALNAGSKFNLSDKSDYTNTIVTKVIDEYISQRAQGEVDSRLSEFMERMFTNCLKAGDLECGLGIAFESQRLDWAQKYPNIQNKRENSLQPLPWRAFNPRAGVCPTA